MVQVIQQITCILIKYGGLLARVAVAAAALVRGASPLMAPWAMAAASTAAMGSAGSLI